jgi:Ankyrin repeat
MLAASTVAEAQSDDAKFDLLCSSDIFRHDPAHPQAIDRLAMAVEFLDTFGKSRAPGEKRAQDYSVMSPEDRLNYLHTYCDAHPSDHISNALEALRHRLSEMSTAAPQNLEAPAVVREFVVKSSPQMASGQLKDDPDKDQRVGVALGRDAHGKIARIADFTMAFTTIVNGAGYPTTDAPLRPLPTEGVKSVADVFIHTNVRDKPPSGNDDRLMRPGVPLFMIGDRGLDVWEIGLVSGVVSIRSESWSVVGPWEPFQSDATKYAIYTQRYLDGRTIVQDFPDVKNAALVRATCAGDSGEIAKALREGADANAKGVEGDAPLFWALECGKHDSMEALLKTGADPNYRLTSSVRNLPQMLSMGLPRQYSVLYNAVDLGDFDAVKLLVQFGGDPNTYRDDMPSETAIDWAFIVGSTRDGEHDPHAWDEFELLLAADKDINHANDLGATIATSTAHLRQYDKLEEVLHRGYSYELAALAYLVQSDSNPEVIPGQAAPHARVMAWLKEKGIQFPVASGFARAAKVWMLEDGSLKVHWGDLHSRFGVVDPAPDFVVRKGEALYDELIARVGSISPGKVRLISRRADDARD